MWSVICTIDMKKRKFEDDGRKISDMSDVSEKFGLYQSGGIHKQPSAEKPCETHQVHLTRAERRKILLSTLGASLAVGLIFIVAAGLFILFCIFIWFR